MRKVALAHGIAATITLLVTGGCASQGPPKSGILQGQAIVVHYSEQELSGWSDMPVGTYHVPNSQVIVSGFQKGGAWPLVFGLAGVAIANEQGASAGKSAVQSSEGPLHISLTSDAQNHLSTLLDKKPFSTKFTLTPSPAAAVLSISGNVVLQFLNESEVRPYVILKAKLIDSQGRAPTWSMRYVASIGAPRPLAGEDGWTFDGGEPLKMMVSAALQRALIVMLTDVATPFARDDNNKIAVDGYYAFLKKRLQVVGYSLAEDADWIAFSPTLPSTSLLAGVNIMDKSVTTFRIATKADPRIKVSADPK